MSDILTQLQTTYDQLLTQFYSTLSYLSQRHPLIAPDPDPNDPYTLPPSEQAPTVPSAADPSSSTGHNILQPGAEDSDPTKTSRPLRPDSPRTFAHAQSELAEDLVRKGRQIEYLISRLPGQGREEADQERRIEELVRQVGEMDERRKKKRSEMRALVKKLDEVVMGMAAGITVRVDEPAEDVVAVKRNGLS